MYATKRFALYVLPPVRAGRLINKFLRLVAVRVSLHFLFSVATYAFNEHVPAYKPNRDMTDLEARGSSGAGSFFHRFLIHTFRFPSLPQSGFPIVYNS